jgi:hypothetical protein
MFSSWSIWSIRPNYSLPQQNIDSIMIPIFPVYARTKRQEKEHNFSVIFSADFCFIFLLDPRSGRAFLSLFFRSESIPIVNDVSSSRGDGIFPRSEGSAPSSDTMPPRSDGVIPRNQGGFSLEHVISLLIIISSNI